MRKVTKFLTACSLSVLYMAGFSASAMADFPERRIQIINPWAAGDAEDTIMRKAAQHMSKELGVPVKVINKPGGGGVVGSSAMLNARPDGYTIGIMTQGPAISHIILKNTPYQFEDYRPIGIFLDYPFVLASRTEASFKNISDLAAYVKQGNEVTLGSFAKFSIPSLYTHLIAESEGFDFARDVALDPVNTLALANKDADIITLPDAAQLVQDKDAKGLLSLTSKRISIIPDVPSYKELYGNDLSIWAGLFAPAGVPDEAIKKLSKAFQNALAQKDIIEYAEVSGAQVYFMDAEETEKRIKSEIQQMSNLIEKISK